LAFLNPLFLLGLFAAGIPLLIHLWSRRQAVTVDFSSLMFLVAAHRQNVRRLQLKQLLILLLRMLIVALIALALARPFLTLGLPLAAVRAKTDVVIVLDNSYSMGYQDVDGVWFEKAKTMATDVLRSLRHGDSASLILMSDIPQPVFRQLTPDVESVIAAIQNAEVSYRATNVQPSIELAHEILSESTQQNKELYLISDFAKNGWDNWETIANRSGSQIVLLPVSERISHNTNIEEILPSHQLIGVDLPFHLNTTIRNYSDTPIAQTTLTFYVGDQKRKTQTFSATADESVMTTLTHIFLAPGTHTGYLELTADRLNTDNRRYFALEALGEIRVLCVGNQTEYLKLALNPLVSQQATGAPLQSSMIHPTACTPAEFETFPLEEYDVILLADVPKISPKVAAQLRGFIRQGKNIVVFGTTNYNLSWVPVQFGQSIIWQIPQQVSKYEESHPIFEIFPENVFSGQYGPQFYQSMTVTPTSDAIVIARFEDETPFLVERREGKSHILFFNCGLQQQPNNSELLVNPYFLPLLQHSVLYVMHSGTPKNINVGETYIASFPENSGGRAWIKRLESSDENAMTVVPIGEDGTTRFEATEFPGIYQIDVKTKDRLFRDFFAVNPPTTEADLTSISLQQASQRVNAQASLTNEIGELDTEALDIKRHGREIWGELLILAVCLLLLEGFLSNRASTLTAGDT
jgi:hypothetical protein